MPWIVGCDTGGTLTDLVALSDIGEFKVAKVASTRPRFDRAVLDGVRELGNPISDITRLFHGTTVTTNAEDQTGRAIGVDHHGWLPRHPGDPPGQPGRAVRHHLGPPAPLIPRRHRLEVMERVDYAGRVVTPLDEDSVRAAAQKIQARGLQSVAVCLINAYVNPPPRAARWRAAAGACVPSTSRCRRIKASVPRGTQRSRRDSRLAPARFHDSLGGLQP
jgi:N-methylhydantoinase A